jgi:hypothetical protein
MPASALAVSEEEAFVGKQALGSFQLVPELDLRADSRGWSYSRGLKRDVPGRGLEPFLATE